MLIFKPFYLNLHSLNYNSKCARCVTSGKIFSLNHFKKQNFLFFFFCKESMRTHCKPLLDVESLFIHSPSCDPKTLRKWMKISAPKIGALSVSTPFHENERCFLAWFGEFLAAHITRFVYLMLLNLKPHKLFRSNSWELAPVLSLTSLSRQARHHFILCIK